MQSGINQQILLARRPDGLPKASDFQLVDADMPEPGDGQMLIQTLYLSVDPGMRAMMAPGASHTTAFELGRPLTGRSVGRVVRSNLAGFAAGDYVYARLGWQHYSLSDGRQVAKVDPDVAPLSTYLGIVGVPGFCAYFGLLDIGKLRAGETVLVSGAAGAVGMTAGQIAKLQGCRVVGTAGTSAKIDYLRDELGFDAAVNYRAADDLAGELTAACPDGIDVYFDNVGGDITQAALSLINHGARIVVCGQTSQCNDPGDADSGCISPHILIKHSALMQGFVVYDYAESAMGGGIDGVLTEYRLFESHGLIRLPAHMTFADGATLPCAALTAWNALYQGQRPLKSGDSVLLLGTGGVSIFALQLASAAGARVIQTSSSDDKLERARALGATDTVNYRQHPEWQDEVQRLTDGRGVDYVVEVGGAGTLPRSLASARTGGTVNLIGVLTGGEIEPSLIMRKSVTLRGLYVGSREMFEAMNRTLSLHRIKPVIDRHFGFDEAPKAFEHLESQRHLGKIVIDID